MTAFLFHIRLRDGLTPEDKLEKIEKPRFFKKSVKALGIFIELGRASCFLCCLYLRKAKADRMKPISGMILTHCDILQ